MRARLILLAGAALLSLGGCAGLDTGAGQAGAAVAVPQGWREAAAAPALPLRDPVLAEILARADASADVAGATARLDAAQAQLRVSRSGLLPALTAQGSETRVRIDDGPQTSSGQTILSLDVPLDLTGARWARSGAARDRLEAARQEQARVRLVARRTAGDLYAGLRTAEEQVAITRRNLEAAQTSLSLARARAQAGLETGLGVAQATANRDAIAARLPGFTQAATAARLGLEAFLGEPPGGLSTLLAAPAPVPWPDLDVAVPPPGDWLDTRPDLAALAALARAAGLDARAARRDRLPQARITASLSDLTGDGALPGTTTTLVGSLAATLFDFGRLDATADAAGARAREAAIAYRQGVITALGEVETQAARVRAADQAVQALDANVASARDQARLAQVRYTSGLSSFLEVLVAERALYETESARAAAEGERASAAFAWRAALGL